MLAERLKRQHRLICAAIHSGRINDLKRMSGRQKEMVVEEEIVRDPQDEIGIPGGVEAAPSATLVDEQFEIEYWPMTQEWTPPPPAPPEEEAAASEEVEEAESSAPVEEEQEQELAGEVLEDGLFVALLDDEDFYSGERYTLRVLIANRVSGDEKPLANAAVSVKILGTTFRPLIYSVKTESDGVATVSTEIPQFTSGRAAVLVRAVTKDQAAELRRIIHPAP